MGETNPFAPQGDVNDPGNAPADAAAPCPFCGEAPSRSHGQVVCVQCGLALSEPTWNRRVAALGPDAREALIEALTTALEDQKLRIWESESADLASEYEIGLLADAVLSRLGARS